VKEVGQEKNFAGTIQVEKDTEHAG